MVLQKYEEKLHKDRIANNILTEYENAFGFTLSTRVGSRAFNNTFGYLIEEILLCSSNIKKAEREYDFESEKILYECKSKFNTVKGSDLFSTLQKKINLANRLNKKFYYIVIVDKKNESRKMPLGKFCKKIETLSEYSPKKNKFISGDKVYRHFFGNDWRLVKNLLLGFLKKCGEEKSSDFFPKCL